MNDKLLAILLILTWPSLAHAEWEIGKGDRTTIRVATPEEGRRVLSTSDAFVQAMSPWDRQARLKSLTAVSEEVFLKHAGAQVIPFTTADETKLATTLKTVVDALRDHPIPLPESVLLVKTTGEEGGLPYTRANAIIIPQSTMRSGTTFLRTLVLHELFHILSRFHPVLRDRLYASIGFEACPNLSLPQDLQNLKLTNPDAPVIEHCIQIQHKNVDFWAAPILHARGAYEGGSLFDYLNDGLILIEQASGHALLSDEAEPTIVSYDDSQLTGFYEQVGENTSYVIHPEEILADNFVFMVTPDHPAVVTPSVVETMQSLLEDYESRLPQISKIAAVNESMVITLFPLANNFTIEVSSNLRQWREATSWKLDHELGQAHLEPLVESGTYLRLRRRP